MEKSVESHVPPTSAKEDTTKNSEDVSPKSPSPNTETPRAASPPPNCAICLGRCKNKSFLDTCLHQFCFDCVVTWSKEKAECPLCKQPFKSIIYNVKSNQHYDEYLVEPPDSPEVELSYIDVPRFRYRTTFTIHRDEEEALGRFLMHTPVMHAPVMIPPHSLPLPRRRRTRRHNRSNTFRHSVYVHKLWAKPLPDVTGRHRVCTPEFYSENPAQIHRLLPWLHRELSSLVLLNGDAMDALPLILNLLTVYPILSYHFLRNIDQYLDPHTRHFLHELHSFASSPYDMIGYDQAVQYTSERPADNERAFQRRPFDTNVAFAGHEGFIQSVDLTSSEPSTSNSLSNSVVAIETVSHTDTEDSSDEVVMVGYIKPPHERTPEVVDLASDSDAMIIENDRISSPINQAEDLSVSTMSNFNGPSPYSSSSLPLETPSTSGLVKIKLKRNNNGTFRTVSSDLEMDEAVPRTSSPDIENNQVALRNRTGKHLKRKHKKGRFSSRDSASTEDTNRDTDTDVESDVSQSRNLRDSDSSESSDFTYRIRKLYKRQQTLASKILKRFKMNNVTSQNDSSADSTNQSSPSTSRGNGPKSRAKKMTHKKSKRKIDEKKSKNNKVGSKKLKLKGRSKSKEKLINKIFENQQVNDGVAKSIDKSKAQAKNKLFNKSFNKHLNSKSPSTSTASQNHHYTSSDSDSETSSKSNLLDILSESLLKSNNPSLSINAHSNSEDHHTQIPNHVKNLINEINENVFHSS